jgi:Ca2+-binding RTX toxin-like protein
MVRSTASDRMHRRRSPIVMVVIAACGAMVTGPAAGPAAAQVVSTCQGFAATIVGAVTIVGTPGPDVIVGSSGRDHVSAMGGDDRICAGAGNDTIIGSDGLDIIVGGGGNDWINGDTGHDQLYGGGGNDTINAGDGDDTINAGDGNDTVSGDIGNDALNGEAGNDTLIGNIGNDTINAGDGDDRIDAGDGDDTMNGGGGNDNVYGGWGNDILSGEAGNDTVNGAGGNDILSGEAGDDTVYGGSDDDTLNGNIGNDHINGGTGTDQIYGTDGDDLIEAGDGDDMVLAGTGNDVIRGEAGHDALGGDEGDDTINGGDGDDTIDAGAGNDMLNGYIGNDTVNAGDGNDIIDEGVFEGSGDDTVYAGAGNDTVNAGDGNDQLFGSTGDDTISGGGGDDTVYAGDDADVIRGEAGNDQLYGGGGNDTISAGDGDDTLNGDIGNDTLTGGPGPDQLIGHAGNDNLTGGLGTDVLFGNTGDDTLNGDDLDQLGGGPGGDTCHAPVAAGTLTSCETHAEATVRLPAGSSLAMSADLRYTAYSDGINVFVHDRHTEQSSLISIDSTGHGANGVSNRPDISADGRHVTFTSFASNLVPDDTNNTSDIFVHDRQTGATTRVSVSSTGEQANTDFDYWPQISADGRHVTFTSFASNLVPDDTNNTSDAFVHDRLTGITTRVSVSSTGNQSSSDSFFAPSISADGRHVAFTSYAPNLVPDDTNNEMDAFVHDRQTGITTRVTISSTGEQAIIPSNGSNISGLPTISADGRYVAFTSAASNLVPDDTNDDLDMFVHDRQTGITTRVSVSSIGLQGDRYSISIQPSFSADGRFVGFASNASNLVPDDTNGQQDVFVHDRQTGTTTRVSVANDGAQANGRSDHPTLSADGRSIAFTSDASNLVPDDTNNRSDVFVRGPLAQS